MSTLPADLFANSPSVIELKLVKDYVPVPKGSSPKDLELKLVNDKFMRKNGLIIFYSPTCPHCVRFAATLEQLSELTQNIFNVGAVNCQDDINGNDILGDYFKISGYPTIKYYNNGEYIDYSGGRDIKELLKFICKKEGLCSLDQKLPTSGGAKKKRKPKRKPRRKTRKN